MDRPRVGGVLLVDHPRVELKKQGVVPDWTLGPTHGALKTRSCLGLDSWIVHPWEVFDSWIVPVRSLKKQGDVPDWTHVES